MSERVVIIKVRNLFSVGAGSLSFALYLWVVADMGGYAGKRLALAAFLMFFSGLFASGPPQESRTDGAARLP